MDECSKISSSIAILSFSLLAIIIGRESQSALLTYSPIDASIGGNLFNSSHLTGLAEDRSLSIGSAGLSQSDPFVRSLSSRLLSALAGRGADAISGDTPQESRTIVFGDVTADFKRWLEFISLTIGDASTDLVTEFQVPILQDMP